MSASGPRRRATLLGAVLAGGGSRRLGRDKAAESLAGIRLIDRAVGAVDPHCAEVVVVSSRPDTPAGAWTRLEDLREGKGPLAGIETALEHAARHGYDAVLVLAVDLPLVGPAALAELVRAYDEAGRAAGGARPVAAAREGDPDFEPLCAVYPTGSLPTVGALLDSGERAARALFTACEGLRVEGIAGAGHNVNDEQGLAAAAHVLEARR